MGRARRWTASGRSFWHGRIDETREVPTRQAKIGGLRLRAFNLYFCGVTAIAGESLRVLWLAYRQFRRSRENVEPVPQPQACQLCPKCRRTYSSTVSLTRSAITAGSSSIANVTVRSNPCGPVMRMRNPPLNRPSSAFHRRARELHNLRFVGPRSLSESTVRIPRTGYALR